MSRQHSIVPHKANYFFLPLEDDYLVMYEELDEMYLPEKEENGIKSGPIDCKSMIASVLEAWMNSKRPTAKDENGLYVYLTYDEWEQSLRYRYKRSTIIKCLAEMEVEGVWIDKSGKYGEPMKKYTGTIKKRHFIQNTFEYQLNLPVVLELMAQLPEQSPFEQKPRPSLGRPKKSRLNKNHSEINGLNKNGLNSDDGSVKIDGQSVKTNDSRPKINAPFYTQITHTKQIYTEEGTVAHSTPCDANAGSSHDSHPHASLTEEQQSPNEDCTASEADVPYRPDFALHTPSQAMRENPIATDTPQGDNHEHTHPDIGSPEHDSDARRAGSGAQSTDVLQPASAPDAGVARRADNRALPAAQRALRAGSETGVPARARRDGRTDAGTVAGSTLETQATSTGGRSRSRRDSAKTETSPGGRQNKGKDAKRRYPIYFSLEGQGVREWYEAITQIPLDETAANARACNCLGQKNGMSRENLTDVLTAAESDTWVREHNIAVTVQDLASPDGFLRWEKWYAVVMRNRQRSPTPKPSSSLPSYRGYSDQAYEAYLRGGK